MKRRVALVANRALGLAHRQLLRAARVIPEVALALFDDPAIERDGLLTNYGPGSAYVTPANQGLGLYPFERRALDEHFSRPPARLLLPGAGAGRELFALRELGYDVDAFDASPPLAAAACEHGGSGAVRIADASTWARDVTAAPASESYDGIFAGWVFWTHIVRRSDRLAILSAFHRVCPRGPVLLSFWRREKVFDLEEEVFEQKSGAAWVRALRRLGEGVLGHAPRAAGTRWTGGMFAHLVSSGELAEEARLCGYAVAHYEHDGSRFPNAVLVPRGDTSNGA